MVKIYTKSITIALEKYYNNFTQHITICPQNSPLFNDTIYNNIAYGNQSASKEDIENITKIVNIYNKISKIGFESNAGTLGGKFSGGEIQRILLARTFIKNADIILLDEPTSNLDNYNESLVLDYIRSIAKDKTVVMIGHR